MSRKSKSDFGLIVGRNEGANYFQKELEKLMSQILKRLHVSQFESALDSLDWIKGLKLPKKKKKKKKTFFKNQPLYRRRQNEHDFVSPNISSVVRTELWNQHLKCWVNFGVGPKIKSSGKFLLGLRLNKAHELRKCDMGGIDSWGNRWARRKNI